MDSGSSSFPTDPKSPPSSGGFVEVNVGGSVYSFLSTIAPDDSLLAMMLSDRWSRGCARDDKGRIFIDRDGDMFAYVLRYLRSGLEGCGLEELGDTDLRRLRIEADYFGLDGLIASIDEMRPGLAEVPVLLKEGDWSRVTPRKVLYGVDEAALENLQGDQRWCLEWSRQSGNKSILKPLKTKRHSWFMQSHLTYYEMEVGETGTYLLLLRYHVAIDPEAFGDMDSDYVDVQLGSYNTALVHRYADETSGKTLVLCGVFDNRSLEERLHQPRLHATSTCATVVRLTKGDRLWVYGDMFGRGGTAAQPADVPPELLNSLTLIKLHGNAFAQFQRVSEEDEDKIGVSDYDADDNYAFLAKWSIPSPGLPVTISAPKLSEDGQKILSQRRGKYLILANASIQWDSSATDEEYEEFGYESYYGSVQLQVQERAERDVHAIRQFSVGSGQSRQTLFPPYSHHDRNGEPLYAPRYVEFNDVVHMERGFKASIVSEGNIALGPSHSFCDKRPQMLSMIQLSSAQQLDRFVVTTDKDSGGLVWDRRVSPFDTNGAMNFERGKSENDYDSTLTMKSQNCGTFLVIGSLPCMCGPNRELLMLVNDKVVSMSKAPELCGDEAGSSTSHHFHEVLELKQGDKVSMSTIPNESRDYNEPRTITFNRSPLSERLPNFGNGLGHMNFIRLA